MLLLCVYLHLQSKCCISSSLNVSVFFRTIASLDYEIFSEFLFQVYVRDSGQPPRSADSPADVFIKVSAAAFDAFWIIYDSDGFYMPALC